MPPKEKAKTPHEKALKCLEVAAGLIREIATDTDRGDWDTVFKPLEVALNVALDAVPWDEEPQPLQGQQEERGTRVRLDLLLAHVERAEQNEESCVRLISKLKSSLAVHHSEVAVRHGVPAFLEHFELVSLWRAYPSLVQEAKATTAAAVESKREYVSIGRGEGQEAAKRAANTACREAASAADKLQINVNAAKKSLSEAHLDEGKCLALEAFPHSPPESLGVTPQQGARGSSNAGKPAQQSKENAAYDQQQHEERASRAKGARPAAAIPEPAPTEASRAAEEADAAAEAEAAAKAKAAAEAQAKVLAATKAKEDLMAVLKEIAPLGELAIADNYDETRALLKKLGQAAKVLRGAPHELPDEDLTELAGIGQMKQLTEEFNCDADGLWSEIINTAG